MPGARIKRLIDKAARDLTATFGSAVYLDQPEVVLTRTSRSVSSNYSLVATNLALWVDASGGNRVITLPTPASVTDLEFSVVKTDSSTNTVTLASAALISGETTAVLVAQWESFTFMSTGSTYRIT